jgi:peptidylprolyl isomerase
MRAISFLLSMVVLLMTAPVEAASPDLANTVYMDLKDGRVVIQLRPDLAPRTVARFEELVRQHFYDGLTFHRVIPGFMAQTGDPRGDGTGGSGQSLPAEFSREHFVRGTLGMARSQDPNSADSQFFICFDDAPWLDGQYTAFGKVTQGMEFVDKIKAGSKQQNGRVLGTPDKIIHMTMAADAKK